MKRCGRGFEARQSLLNVDLGEAAARVVSVWFPTKGTWSIGACDRRCGVRQFVIARRFRRRHNPEISDAVLGKWRQDSDDTTRHTRRRYFTYIIVFIYFSPDKP
jgi:hypothetical protein